MSDILKINLKSEFSDALRERNFNKAKEILMQGLDVNNGEPFSYLQVAIYNKDLEVMKFLITHGADINDNINFSLHKANSFPEGFIMMLEAGSTVVQKEIMKGIIGDIYHPLLLETFLHYQASVGLDNTFAAFLEKDLYITAANLIYTIKPKITGYQVIKTLFVDQQKIQEALELLELNFLHLKDVSIGSQLLLNISPNLLEKLLENNASIDYQAFGAITNKNILQIVLQHYAKKTQLEYVIPHLNEAFYEDVLINQKSYIDLLLNNSAMQSGIINIFRKLITQDCNKAVTLFKLYIKDSALFEYGRPSFELDFRDYLENDFKTAKVLIEKFIESDIYTASIVKTLFHTAFPERTVALKFLLDKGVNIFIDDAYGKPLVEGLTAEELKELDISQKYIEYEVSKVECLSQKPILLIEDRTKPHKTLDWLEGNSYIQQCQPFKFSGMYFLNNYLVPTYFKMMHGGKFITELNIHEVLNSLPQNHFSSLVSEVVALKYIDHNGYSLIVSNPMRSGQMVGGYALDLNHKTVLSKERPEKFFQTTFIHESIHQAMSIVFGGHSQPYDRNDSMAQNAYEHAIRLTLDNIYQQWFNKEIGASKFNSTWELGNYVRGEISKDLGSYTNSYLFGYLLSYLDNYAPILNLDEVNNEIGLRLKSLTNSEYSLFRTMLSFLNTYTSKLYSQDSEHCEFIAYYSETFSEAPSPELTKIFEPISEYVDTFLMPKLAKFAINHPYHNLIEDSIIYEYGNICSISPICLNEVQLF